MKFLTKPLSPYEQKVMNLSQKYGGFQNTHAHLDRGDTLGTEYLEDAGINTFEASNLPLSVKQKQVGELHMGPAYKSKSLRKRIKAQLLEMAANGTRSVTSLIDVTPDIDLRAFDIALELKAELTDQIEFKVGIQPIFGFMEENHPRWKLYREAAKRADVLGGLPEKDAGTNRIGFDRHIVKIIELALELGIEAHIHTDQGNDPRESQTEDLIQAVRWLNSTNVGKDGQPLIWAVHALSMSACDEYRRKKQLDELKKYNVGIISCPRAAKTMRQLRPLLTPTHNCIAPLLHIIKWEIPLSLGTDNTGDMFIPTGWVNLLDEVVCAADALRYSDPVLWTKIACGVMPNDMDRVRIDRALEEDHKAFLKIDPNFPFIMPG